MTIEVAIAAVFGLLTGSFLNVCIHRLPRALSVVRPRSFCPTCQATVAWYDNIPVLSYLLLGGRCRQCRTRISMRYPVVELMTAAFFGWAAAQHGISLTTLKLCVFAALIIGMMFTDLEQRFLHEAFTVGGAIAGLIFAAVVPVEGLFSALLLPAHWSSRFRSIAEAAAAGALGGGALWMVGAFWGRLRNKEALGLGDVLLVTMMGTFLGVEGLLLAVMAGSLAGSILGLAFIAIRREDWQSYQLPFGTFLGAGALLVAFARGG